MASVCGLILAAGASSRMGTDKALLPWPPGAADGATLLSAAIAALKPFTQEVVVVAGKNAEKLALIVASSGASMVLNPAPERGQFSSLQIGLREVLARGCDAAMITPVDCPPLSAASLKLLREAFEQTLARGRWAVAPESDGRRGHPLLAGRALIDAFLGAPATGNARDVKRAYAQHFESVRVPDLHLGTDMNTPEEYAAISAVAHRQPR
ncbi:MAG: nucleotidyltransferase family protein [Terracidiphilus sp.]